MTDLLDHLSPLHHNPADIVAAGDPGTAHETFVNLIERARPAWQRSAACRSHPTDMFFPGRGEVKKARTALAVCDQCPVLVDCRTWALDTDEYDEPRAQVGIVGGLSALGRRQARTARRTAAGIVNGYTPEVQEKLDDADWLRHRYITEGQSANRISADIGCSAITLRSALERHGIPIRTRPAPAPTPPELLDRDWLASHYPRYTDVTIAEILGVHPSTVERARNRLGIAGAPRGGRHTDRESRPA